MKYLTTLLLLSYVSLFAQPSASVQEGIRLFQAGNYVAAIPYLQEAVQQNPQEEQFAVALAVACVQSRRPVLARTAVDNGLARFPRNLTLKQLKSEFLIQDEHYTAALNLLNELDDALANGQRLNGISRNQIQGRMGQVYSLQGSQLTQTQPTEALIAFRNAQRYLPDSVAVYQNITLLLLQQEKWQESNTASDAGLARFPRNEALLQMKGKSLIELKKYEEALPVYAKLYQIKNDIDTGIVYGQLQGATGKPADAQETFKQLLTRYPREERLYDMLIRINEQGLNMNSVVGILKQKRAAFPNDINTVRRLAQSYESQSKFDLARAMYDTLSVMTNDDPNVAFSIAKTYEKQDDISTAITQYQTLLQKEPANTRVLHALGMNQMRANRWGDAQSTFQQWLSIDTTTTTAYFRLGQVAEHLSQLDAARTYYQQAIQKGSLHPLPYFRYGILSNTPTEQCIFIESGLRKALRESKTLQEQIAQNSRQKDLSAASNESLESQHQMVEMDSLATNAYHAFAQKCPPNDVELLSKNLLREYAGSGKLHYLLGTFYTQQQRIDLAEFQFQEAATFAPALIDNQLALANIKKAKSDWVQAILIYERIITIQPENPIPYKELVGLYQQINRLNDLADRWIARFRSMPKNELLKEALIECLHKSNRFEEAQLVISGKI